MGRKERRVGVQLDPKEIANLTGDELRAILRGADDLIMQDGRCLLVKVLKGSRAQEVLKLGLDQSPVYGYYRQLSPEEILARIDWVIEAGYLDIQYDGRLPLLAYTVRGWETERETYAEELLRGFDRLLAAGPGPFDMSYLKDRNRGMILLLLDKVEATGDRKYIPVLNAWEQVDYKKVQARIRQVIRHLHQSVPADAAATNSRSHGERDAAEAGRLSDERD
ncbi:MAG TPA: RQC-minor-1 family DNA-binding protein [Candidatus Methylomirabilis sp.]|nr:RQC-minor-1 family DNA-binding protein [Candidatus Methylomirabilis sp.]